MAGEMVVMDVERLYLPGCMQQDVAEQAEKRQSLLLHVLRSPPSFTGTRTACRFVSLCLLAAPTWWTLYVRI
jgi:hypothetical protein